MNSKFDLEYVSNKPTHISGPNNDRFLAKTSQVKTIINCCPNVSRPPVLPDWAPRSRGGVPTIKTTSPTEFSRGTEDGTSDDGTPRSVCAGRGWRAAVRLSRERDLMTANARIKSSRWPFCVSEAVGVVSEIRPGVGFKYAEESEGGWFQSRSFTYLRTRKIGRFRAQRRYIRDSIFSAPDIVRFCHVRHKQVKKFYFKLKLKSIFKSTRSVRFFVDPTYY